MFLIKRRSYIRMKYWYIRMVETTVEKTKKNWKDLKSGAIKKLKENWTDKIINKEIFKTAMEKGVCRKQNDKKRSSIRTCYKSQRIVNGPFRSRIGKERCR